MKVSAILKALLAICTLSVAQGEYNSGLETPLETAGSGTVPFFCEWLSSGNTHPSCAAGLETHCPSSCNSCDANLCSDSELTFYWREDLVDCMWLQNLGKRKRRNLCAREVIRNTCRATCDLCGDLAESLEVVDVDKDTVPFIPDGLKITTLPDNTSPTMPVLKGMGLTLWAFSFFDNRSAFQVVAFNDDGYIVRSWYLPGARYLVDISIDPSSNEAVFTGQSDLTVSLALNELYCVDTSLFVADVDKDTVPSIPDGLKITTLPDKPTMPVLKYKKLTFWAFSFYDNRSAFQVIAFRPGGKIAKQFYLPGARYLVKIEIDYPNKKVVFYGQSDLTVELTFNEVMM